VFPVRYELNFYIFRRNSVFKELNTHSSSLMNSNKNMAGLENIFRLAIIT
jgi:hypothetical protein